MDLLCFEAVTVLRRNTHTQHTTHNTQPHMTSLPSIITQEDHEI